MYKREIRERLQNTRPQRNVTCGKLHALPKLNSDKSKEEYHRGPQFHRERLYNNKNKGIATAVRSPVVKACIIMKPRSEILYDNEDIKGTATPVRSSVVKDCIIMRA